ncbi:MAG: enoyl-CoA hydratase-related protein [Rickettsiales bacterium]|jgi:enoyl-CoA hydratase/carnithine racemase
MPEHIRVEIVDRVGKITFNTPKNMNALTPAMLAEVVDAVAAFEADPEVRVLLFTGEGRGFSAGGDMDFMKRLSEMSPFEIKETVYKHFAGAAKAIKLCPKPTIAAVNGAAVGAGCEIAVACDFRIASEDAMFSEAWIKLACIPPLGGMFLLPQIVGLSKATEMLMLGTQVDGAEAVRIGLANRMVPAAELDAAAMDLARQLAAGSGRAQAVIKEGLRRGMESTLAAEWEFNIYAQSMLISAGDFGEAVTAFKEKRKPNFG